jgi:hypothetical protein
MKKRTNLFLNTESTDALTNDEISLLYLMPLIQTAWVCGAVSPREKQVIFSAARLEAIDELHEFNNAIDEFLIYQPSQSFFEKCLLLINSGFEKMTVKERTKIKTTILQRCRQVAESAGEKSPMDTNHTISPEETHLLNRFKELL